MISSNITTIANIVASNNLARAGSGGGSSDPEEPDGLVGFVVTILAALGAVVIGFLCAAFL